MTKSNLRYTTATFKLDPHVVSMWSPRVTICDQFISCAAVCDLLCWRQKDLVL